MTEKAKTVIDKTKVTNHIYFNPTSIKEEFGDVSNIKTLLETRDHLSIHPTDAEMPKGRAIYYSISKNIYDVIRNSGRFCEGINMDFVKESLVSADAILLVAEKKAIYGFATLVFKSDENLLYIDLICTNIEVKGCGTYMLEMLKELSGIVGLASIQLSSVTSAVPFYLKNQFECDGLCTLRLKVPKLKFKSSKTKSNKTKNNKTKSRSKSKSKSN